MPVAALAAPHSVAPASLVAGIVPVGLSTFTLTFGAYTDPLGTVKFAGLVGKLSLSKPLRYQGGEVQGSVTVTIGSDGTATVGPLVNPSDPQVAAQGVQYVMDWHVGRFDDCPGSQRTRTFTPPAGVSVLDFDTLDIYVPPTPPTSTTALVDSALVGTSTAG